MRTNLVCRLLQLVVISLFVSACAAGGSEVEAPQVSLDVRGEETYQVGQDVIRIHITATDPQGLDLQFEVLDAPSRSTFQTFSNSAVFTWDPITSDVTSSGPRRLVFKVSNSRGVSTERVVLLTIQPGNTVPRFLNSSSELYNPATGRPLEITVRVRDDDSPQVILSMPADRAPQGASFEQVDNFEGRFRWMPSPVQLQNRMHTVVFIADDGDNDPVEYRVTIIIQSADTPGPGPGPGGGGSGEAPTCEEVEGIEHQPLGAQRTAQSYRIEGRVVDQSSSWEEAVVYFTTDDPLGEASYTAATLNLAGNSFEGSIPNPLLTAGESEVISYRICVFSSMDYLCSPWEFPYRFVAYSPDEDKCRDDGRDFSTPGRAGALPEKWTDYRVCEGLPKYFHRELEAGESMDVLIAFSPGQAPTIEATLTGSTPAVSLFDCLGFGFVEAQGPGLLEIKVDGQDQPFHLIGIGELPECPGGQLEPNNTPGQATLISSDFQIFDEIGICTEEDIDLFALELVRGDEFSAFMSFTHANGDLDMTLYAPSQVEEILPGGFGVAQGWSSSDNESIDYVAQESGFYYLKIETSSSPNIYDLAVERICKVDGAITGNHTQFDTEFLSFGSHQGVKLCENQSAWFGFEHFSTTKGQWLGEVAVRYGSLNGLEVRLVDDWGEVVGNGNLSGGFIDFSYEPEPGEVIYIEVRANQPMIIDLTVLDFS